MWDGSCKSRCKKNVACLVIVRRLETGNFYAIDLHDKHANDASNCFNACGHISCADYIKIHLCAFPVELTRAVFIYEKAASIPHIGVTRSNEILFNLLLESCISEKSKQKESTETQLHLFYN